MGSVFYGYIHGAHGREDSFVQVYVKDMGDDTKRQAVRQRVLGLGRFRPGGDYTAELLLSDQESVELARKALEIVWEEVGELQEAPSGDGT